MSKRLAGAEELLLSMSEEDNLDDVADDEDKTDVEEDYDDDKDEEEDSQDDIIDLTGMYRMIMVPDVGPSKRQ